MSDILVERHWDQALSDADMLAMLGSGADCLGIHRVDWHASRLSADGRELFCHFEKVRAAEHAGASCLVTHRVQRVRTYLSADRRRMISLYQAPDPESVRLALHDASMPVERVWAFR